LLGFSFHQLTGQKMKDKMNEVINASLEAISTKANEISTTAVG
jgi:hypothetical protein